MSFMYNFKESYSINDYYEGHFTHLIVGDNTRTLKIIFALVKNAWILNKDYLYSSITKGKWVKEKTYQSKHYPKKEIRVQPLFTGIDFYIEFKKTENNLSKDIFI